MACKRWFEVPINEARELVAPDLLEDVLEALKKQGLIIHFLINAEIVVVGTDIHSRFELALFSEEASDLSHFYPKIRRKH
jgi:hypothetical protein